MEKKRILIIDDEPSFTRMVRLNLEKTGIFEVREENRAAGASIPRGISNPISFSWTSLCRRWTVEMWPPKSRTTVI